MSNFAVYTDHLGRRSTVHVSSCYRYPNRQRQTLPHNGWHSQLFDTLAHAADVARTGLDTSSPAHAGNRRYFRVLLHPAQGCQQRQPKRAQEQGRERWAPKGNPRSQKRERLSDPTGHRQHRTQVSQQSTRGTACTGDATGTRTVPESGESQAPQRAGPLQRLPEPDHPRAVPLPGLSWEEPATPQQDQGAASPHHY